MLLGQLYVWKGKMSQKKKRSLLFRLATIFVLLIGLFVLFCNWWVLLSTQSRVYDSIDEVKNNTIGLVLGTSKKVAPDSPNPHFENRMAAAAELYQEGKVRVLLVSGDGASKYYNEPRDMTAKLVGLGVEPQAIRSDNSGLRTLDSIIRAEKVYQLEKITIISDGFHVYRALFIARHAGLDAVAFCSTPVDLKHSFKARLREYLARVLVVLDLYVFDTQPEILGEPVALVVSEPKQEELKAKPDKAATKKPASVEKAGSGTGQ